MKKILSLIFVVCILLAAVPPEILAAGNTAENMYEAGMEYFEKEDYGHAFSYFQISGEVKGYAPSLNMLGVCYRDGLGTEQDIGEAERCFRLSADQGYAPAQENLAVLEGALREGVKKEEEKEQVDLGSVSVGDYIIFGAYEQDDDLTNGKEPIEWRVLDVRDGKALLISKYVLDCKKYNTTNIQGTWESSSIRRWLNEEFLNDAFSVEEQTVISTTAVIMNNGIEPGNDTEDKIFLLSFAEAEKYFDSDSDRQCSPTMYAKSQGCRTNEDNNCWWWLRSRYLITSDFAGVVGTDGGLDIGIVFVDYVFNFGARPALWVNLES